MTEFGVLPCPRHSVVGHFFLPDGGFPEFAAVAKHGNGARFRVSSRRGSQVRILAAAISACPLPHLSTSSRATFSRTRSARCASRTDAAFRSEIPKSRRDL